MTEQEAIQKLWQTGHMASPLAPDANNLGGPPMDGFAIAKPPKALEKLTFNDKLVKQALASYQDFHGVQFDTFALEEHGRPGIPDGEGGPATKRLLEMSRCAVPDFSLEPLPAVGTGNWARCHGVGNFHRCTVYINRSSMPSFVQPVFDRVWANVRKAYREVGLDLQLTDNSGTHNTSWTWVQPDGGWIGLAIVGRNLDCGDKIWARYDKDYRGGSSEAAVLNQWSSLCQHEMGHNVGLGHSRGGVMNPSIINGLPMGTWQGDPSLSQLRQWYGGEPVPGDDPTPPGPGPGPTPPGSPRPVFTARVVIPPNTPPGTYDLISAPKPEV